LLAMTGGPPSFSGLQCQAFPKICGSNAKLFQAMSWRFCGISGTYKPPNQKLIFFQTFLTHGMFQQPPHGAKSVGIVEATSKHGNTDSVFQKENRRCR
jgi:hypothetical protein